MGNMSNCPIMHVVYFGRTSYGMPSLGSTMGNQGSTDYLIIQLFSSQLLGLCLDYGATLVIILCEAVVFSYLGLAVRPSSVPEVLDCGTGHSRYLFKTHALH